MVKILILTVKVIIIILGKKRIRGGMPISVKNNINSLFFILKCFVAFWLILVFISIIRTTIKNLYRVKYNNHRGFENNTQHINHPVCVIPDPKINIFKFTCPILIMEPISREKITL